jgi:tetratricopeptide (TPR) repeat protein
MERAGHGLTVYRAVPDRVLAFSVLAPRLQERKQLPDRATLLQEHAQHHGQDPLLRYYQAELHLLRGDPVQAEQCFAAELGRASVGDVYRLRQGLYRARIQLGKTAETYQEFGVEAFESLLNLCREESNAGELDKLLAAHRQADPDDPHFPAWELERAWLKRDYADAMKLITEHRTGLLALPRHRLRMENYLVRCLVKLDRIPEAVQEAEKIAVKNQHILLVLAHAAAGPDSAIAAVQKVAKEAWALRLCYTDPDVGPILKSEPFAPFRARFPKPDELDDDILLD